MSTSSEQLAKTLQSIPFVQVIQHDQQGTAVNVMCRVRPAEISKWASLAHEILLAAQRSGGTWDAHISRSYVLKDRDLKYAWNFIIVGRTPEAVHAVVADAVIPLLRRRSAVRVVTDDVQKAPPPRRRPAHPPEADSMGNPIVPEEDMVDSVPMAGFDPDADRNAPDNGKGAWSIGGKKGSFVPASVKRRG